MPDRPPLDPDDDPFRPPAVPTMVGCLHCGREYESYLIEWRVGINGEGKPEGFCCCPTPGCHGLGFGFDILPTDRNYRDENGGWYCDDEEDDDEQHAYEEDDEVAWGDGGLDDPQGGDQDYWADGEDDDNIPF